MSSKPNSTSSRRSLRNIKYPDKQTEPCPTESTISNASGLIEKLRTKKRKNQTDLRSDVNRSTSTTIKTSLEDVGVSVGASTSRERLLDLLTSRINPKRPRLSGDRRRIASKRDQVKTTVSPSSPEINASASQASTVDFSLYHVSDLEDMLQKVGMDTGGLNKEALIISCKAHSDIITLPDFSVSMPPSDSTIPQPGRPSRTVDPATQFPSLEHGRLAFPRPNPTVLNPIVTPKDRKGKGKEIPEDDEDWTPTNEVSSPESDVDDQLRDPSGTKNSKNPFPNTHQSGSNTTNPNTTTNPFPNTHQSGSNTTNPNTTTNPFPNTHQSGSNTTNPNTTTNPFPNTHQSGSTGSNTTNPNTTQPDHLFEEGFNRNEGVQDPDLASTVAEQTRTIAHLNVKLTKTNAKVEALESEVKTLTSIVDKLIGKSKDSEESGSKSGGRIAARVRFHIACMLGPGAHEKLPNPATSEEKTRWLSQQPIDSVQFNVDLESETPDAAGANSDATHSDGPGHPDSSPQQLSVIHQMMKAVRVESFRPDFSQSLSSGENKWLWDLAMKIFIKLVECGEYTGIPRTSQGISTIKKCFTSHFQSLQKRNREENWDVARKQKAADEVRRSTRMRHLKALRDQTVLSRQCLWPLSAIMQAVCSDDETEIDEDGSLDGVVRANRPCRVRRLIWRSEALESVCLLVDKYKSRVGESIPGNSPGQKGRRPRQRIRGDDRPISRVEAPVGLPVDCYSVEWLGSLSAVQRAQLEIHAAPVLEQFISLLATDD